MTATEPDLSKVMSWEFFLNSDYEDKVEGKELYSRARAYLESFSWCLKIKESYIGMLYPMFLGLFLFKIDPGEGVGEWVWVIVGDIPPAVLPLAAGHNPGMALDVYLGEMQEWVNAVDEGKSVEDMLPVNAPPTKEYADMLRGRLEFLGENILLAEYRNDLGYDPDDIKR